jgi:Zn-dependent oligopeptidase
MRLFEHWKIILGLTAVILASGLSGSLLGHGLARRQFNTRNDPASWNEHVSSEFDRVVKPTPEQATKIQAHLEKAVRQLQVIRMETIGRSTNVIWQLVAEVEQELTPEQREAFEVMKPKASDMTIDLLNVKPQSNGNR